MTRRGRSEPGRTGARLPGLGRRAGVAYRRGMAFTDPQVILFVADCERAAAFYRRLGFHETFRSPAQDPIKVELLLGGFGLGLALPEPAAQSHGLSPVTTGHRACLTLWTDDVAEAYTLAVEAGGRPMRGPHPFRDGSLSVAFVEDPDGHPVQLVRHAPPEHLAPPQART